VFVAEDDAALRQHYVALTAAPATEHVHEDVWAQLATGELTGPARTQAFDHATRCAECAAIYHDVTALRQDAPRFGVPVAEQPAASRGRWIFAGATAAAAALVVAFVMRPAPPEPPPEPSGGNELRSGTSAAPVPLAPRGRVTDVPLFFGWSAAADARAYRVELLTAQLESVWSSPDVGGTEIAWPNGLRPVPGRYYWHVGAIPSWSRSAQDVAWSPLVEIELVP
jgi:hypothetical protein